MAREPSPSAPSEARLPAPMPLPGPPLSRAPEPAEAQSQAPLEATDPQLDGAADDTVAADAVAEGGAAGGPQADDERHAGDGQPDEQETGLDAEALDGLLAGVLDDLGAAHHRPFSRG
jgi:hypothetical protein